MTIRKPVLLPLLVILIFTSARAADKPKITLDEFFNYVEFTGVNVSPDGQSVVITTDRADWEQNIFRKDLWLYRDNGRGQITGDSDGIVKILFDPKTRRLLAAHILGEDATELIHIPMFVISKAGTIPDVRPIGSGPSTPRKTSR